MSFEKKMEKTVAALKKAADQESRTKDLFEQFSDCGVAACNLAIDAGEMLLDLKGTAKKEGKKWGDVCANLPVSQSMLTRYMRLSAHKVTARALVNDNRAFNLDEVVKQLPKVNEPQAPESKADPKNLAYTGKQPPSNGDAPRDSDDWHTPMKYIELARDVMGGIDLDPFTSVEANTRVGATSILTLADDAMNCSWADTDRRTCWMNPPYSRGASAQAVDKFLQEYDYGSFEEAVVLMNASTDTNWCQRLLNICTAFCLTNHRISFENTDGKSKNGNTKGQIFFYFGPGSEKFVRVFAEQGAVFRTGVLPRG